MSNPYNFPVGRTFEEKAPYPEEQLFAPEFNDAYKWQHEPGGLYPRGISWAYTAHTYRKSRIADIGDGKGNVEHAVVYGTQGLLHDLHYRWQKYFFDYPRWYVLDRLHRKVESTYAKTSPGLVARYNYKVWMNLYDYGKLPILVKKLPEGLHVPVPFDENSQFAPETRVSPFTIESTAPGFFWVPEFLETELESEYWQPSTIATLASKNFATETYFANLTSDHPEKVFTLDGDFSARGMAGTDAAKRGTGGHLLFFGVTSTMSGPSYLQAYYNAPEDVNAYGISTEHSVACTWGKKEITFLMKLLTEFFPEGNVTHVSDSYDFWGLINDVYPKIAASVEKRDGRYSTRPDSGDPYLILTGDPNGKLPVEKKGLVQALWDIAGGSVNSKGYRNLNPKWGVTYGDAMTPSLIYRSDHRLMKMGFDTTTVVKGNGSFTYQYNTRDTLGQAYKTIAMTKDGQFYEVFKDPKTDSGHFKKSQRGLIAVYRDDNGEVRCKDGLTPETIRAYDDRNLLLPVYREGKFLYTQDFSDMRELAAAENSRVYGHQI